jgi:hypothetical protein
VKDNQTYLDLIDAIQSYVQDTAGDDRIARDWVLIMGVQKLSDVTMDDMSRVEVRAARSPSTPPYTVTGLMDFAAGCFTATEMPEEEEEED